MVSFTFHRRSTCVFFKRYIEESFSRNAHRNYSPFGGKYGIWQSCLSAYQNDSRYLYFDSDFSCLSFPECLRLFILTVVEQYKKTDSQCEVEVTILYLQEDNTFFTRGFHTSPIHSTNSFQQPVLSRVVSLNLALNRPCKCSIRLWIIVNAKDSNRANL